MFKILFVATVVKGHIMLFHIPYLKMLKEMGCETAVAARNDYENRSDCIIPYCDQYYDISFERSPMKRGNIRAYRMLKKVICEGNYNVIHCHTPMGAMLTRLAARSIRGKGTKVIYTAHGFHFYKGARLVNWLIYYPVERLLARWTDVLITINKEDYVRAKSFSAKKTCYVPGIGIDLSKYSVNTENRELKRIELGLEEKNFVLLSVGELIERKNHAIVLHALAEIKKKSIEFNRIKYLICGQGCLKDYLEQLAEELRISEHVKFLGFRKDVSQIANCSDLFVFMSLQEGLPVALMEAMASGLPSVCSNIRGNTDLIDDKQNGYLVNNDASALSSTIINLMASKTDLLRIGAAARNSVENFELDRIQALMREIYIAALY